MVQFSQGECEENLEPVLVLVLWNCVTELRLDQTLNHYPKASTPSPVSGSPCAAIKSSTSCRSCFKMKLWSAAQAEGICAWMDISKWGGWLKISQCFLIIPKIYSIAFTGCKKKYHSKKYFENISKIILFQHAYLIMKYGKNYFDFFHYIECLNMVQIFSIMGHKIW